jgi:hypothetical protein
MFYALYICVAVATFRHSAYGFASIEGGSIGWGMLSALAIDLGMMLSATGLQRGRSRALVIGLAGAAIASTYTQWLYAITTAQAIPVAPGAIWLGNLARTVIDARILLLPALLPALSVVYAFSAKSQSAQVTQIDTLADIAARIRGQTDAAGERARLMLDNLNGHQASNRELAKLLNISEGTVRKVGKEVG